MTDQRPYCLLAEFDTPDGLMAAVAGIRAAGYRRIDAYSPFPIPGLAEALGFDEDRLPWLTVAGGLAGAGSMLLVQYSTNVIDYPINIGGRELAAWPSFVFPAFEVGTLWAVLAAAIGMLLMNRLPGHDHPLIRFDEFHLATDDRFFLAVLSEDSRFDLTLTRHDLDSLAPERVWEVPG